MTAVVALGNLAVLVALFLAWRAAWRLCRDYLAGRWGGRHAYRAGSAGVAAMLDPLDEEAPDDGYGFEDDRISIAMLAVELPADWRADDGIRVHS